MIETPSPTHYYEAALATDAGVWLTGEDSSSDDLVARYDLSSGTITRIRGAHGWPEATQAGSLWISGLLDDSLTRIDVATGAADGLTSMVVGAGALWVTNSVDGGCDSCDREDNELIRVDLSSGRVTHRWDLEHPDGGDVFDQPGVFADGQDIWVAFGSRAWKIRTDI